MEADSTTYDGNLKDQSSNKPCLPFSVNSCNLQLYLELTVDNGEKKLQNQIVERLQNFGLIPKSVNCPTAKPECRVVCKSARVIDRVQWVCESCGTRQPIRLGSFFLRLQCSLLQALQIILAWCEDADINFVAQQLDVKPRVAVSIYDKLDEIAIKEQSDSKLGGENSVVLAEMYPDCLNRLSPDTTDQPRVHRILMLADTNHIPTHYWLQVMRDDSKTSSSSSLDYHTLKAKVEEVVSNVAMPNSFVVTGHNLPLIDGASSIQQLGQHCDANMHNFLTTRIWKQAASICAASRDLCASAGAVQRYLHTAMYRLRYSGDHFYRRILLIIARDFTDRIDRG